MRRQSWLDFSCIEFVYVEGKFNPTLLFFHTQRCKSFESTSPNSFLMNDSKFIPFFAALAQVFFILRNVMSFSTWAAEKFKSFSNKKFFQLQNFPLLQLNKTKKNSIIAWREKSHRRIHEIVCHLIFGLKLFFLFFNQRRMKTFYRFFVLFSVFGKIYNTLTELIFHHWNCDWSDLKVSERDWERFKKFQAI